MVPNAPWVPLTVKFRYSNTGKTTNKSIDTTQIIQHRCPEVWEASETIEDPKGYLGDYPRGPTSAFCTPKQRAVEQNFAIQAQEKQRTSR
jgi:hypothetical protein